LHFERFSNEKRTHTHPPHKNAVPDTGAFCRLKKLPNIDLGAPAALFASPRTRGVGFAAG